ncbi:hypothetical protein BT96DRAFT_153141 [Gymnopus androsaceus JB14]|uniref:F-box domain-containing protein n=1 Tax=Gymnopus androsaceus JB14 TaxID=1447944 RepID=A0A6A4IF73_9AGAR|nr:hypothetical protein BT96DRAFT_153141 [Gymnopus androsaceus JB14]
MAQYLSQNRIEEPIWLEPVEITFLRMRMSEIHCDLSRYAEIVQANSFLEAQISSELRLQRDAKFVELASIRNILSPVRRIPVEILSEIFELARLPEDGIFHSNHTIVLYTYNVSSVCAAWRKTALATPRLWSKLCFDWEIYTKTVATKVEWVKEWIDRSQSLPLDVYLSLRLGSASGQFLEHILDCHHRIRHWM